MDLPPLPDRPLALRIPGIGLGRKLLVAFGMLALLALVAASAVFVAPPLLSDWQVRDTARRALAGQIDSGSCRVKMFVNTCTVTLSAGKNPDVVTRFVTYVFVDAHAGDYSAAVLADPARPALLTTDLGLEKLVNRTATLGAFWGLMLLGGVAVLRGGMRQRRDRAEMASWHRLRLVPLRLASVKPAGNGRANWSVTPPGDQGKGRAWTVPAKAAPIFLGPDLILGAAGPTGELAMPLDQDLSWIDLTEAERANLRTRLAA